MKWKYNFKLFKMSEMVYFWYANITLKKLYFKCVKWFIWNEIDTLKQFISWLLICFEATFLNVWNGLLLLCKYNFEAVYFLAINMFLNV